MIWVTGEVDGKEFKEPFSKGILARSLNVADIGFGRAYDIASCIESDLIKNNIYEINIKELAVYIFDRWSFRRRYLFNGF